MDLYTTQYPVSVSVSPVSVTPVTGPMVLLLEYTVSKTCGVGVGVGVGVGEGVGDGDGLVDGEGVGVGVAANSGFVGNGGFDGAGLGTYTGDVVVSGAGCSLPQRTMVVASSTSSDAFRICFTISDKVTLNPNFFSSSVRRFSSDIRNSDDTRTLI